MIEQPALFDAPPAEPEQPPAPQLNERQQTVLDHVLATGDGVYTDEAGAIAHTVPGPRGGRTHSFDHRCDFCAREGKRILTQLVDLGLVKRRRGERGRGLLYVPVNAAANKTDAPCATDGPGDLPEGF